MGSMFKQLSLFLFILMMTISLVGCNTEEEVTGEPESDETSEPVAEEQKESKDDTNLATEYPLTLTDATGEEVTFEAEPTKLVSLIPSETEILFALGAGEEVLAVDDFSDFPEEVANLPKLGSTYSGLNIEQLIALQPDVIFLNAALQAEVAKELRDQGFTVFASNPQSVEEIMEAIKTIGVILNNQEEGQTVTGNMEEKLQYVKDKVLNVEPKKVYAEFSAGWSFGSDQFASDLITLAGGENIFADQSGWFEVSPEDVIKRNPEVILYTSGEKGANEENKEQIISRDGWGVIEAVQNENVVGIDSNKASRVGPRITDSLIEIFEAIHPELAE